LSDEIKFNL